MYLVQLGGWGGGGMLFYEKLDFLMKITNTTNKSLSMHTSLDPSFISRLRRGQRNPSKDNSYITSMAKYFSRHCSESYQRKILYDMLKISAELTESELCDKIIEWLSITQGPEFQNVGTFLTRIANKMPLQMSSAIKQGNFTVAACETSVLFGFEGKREAVISFLFEVLAQNKPLILLLFSDEPTDWMTSDPAFMAKWASLMSEVLARGNKIRIIHTVSRDLDEMLNAIAQWVPLYMTGLIEPYYYPKKRDGIFKRTLFIAPGTAAVISTSVGSMVNEAANFLIRSCQAVAAVEQEFNQYLRLCQPLMRIFAAANLHAYINTLYEFEKEKANAIIKTESLSLLTMPISVQSSIMGRISQLGFDHAIYFNNRMELFKKSIDNISFTEIIHLPGLQDVRNGSVAVAFSDILYGGTIFYSATEYILHLENIVSLLKEHSGFHVCLITKEADSRYMVYVKEDVGVVVAKTSAPPIILSINEKYMTSAFWEFLTITAGEKTYNNPNNKKVIKTLIGYIKQLKACDSPQKVGQGG